MADGDQRRVVLVGGGLANLHVLREWRRRPAPGAALTVVSPAPEVWYSGMVPGFLRGDHEPPALRIDLAAMARAAGARLVVAPARRVRAADRMVDVDGEAIPYDVCAIDVGGGVAGDHLPGVREHAVPLRPMARAMEIRARVDALVASGSPFAVVVVGAGAGGVEVALALQARIAAAAARGSVALVDGSRLLVPGAPRGMREGLSSMLASRGIGVALGSAVTLVRADAVSLASGAWLPASLVVWATGAAPAPLVAASGLAHDAAGWLRVDRALRVAEAPSLLGAGDCAVVDGRTASSRSGATAVRQGPTLLRSIRSALGDGRPGRYRPPGRSLAILDTSDGRALARWGGLHGHGGWARWLKRAIDRRFMARMCEGCDETVRGDG